MSALAHARPSSRPHCAGIAAPERKPLYLAGKDPATIDAQGETLVLRRTGAAPQRFPLTRVARIICNRNATWTGAALALCLAEGITITLLDGHGQALGSVQPSRHRQESLETLLETYLELPDWPQRFANWRQRRRQATLSACAKRASEAGRSIDEQLYRELKREFVYLGRHPLVFSANGQGWCHAFVVDRLQEEGLQASYWGWDATPFDLATELAALLWAELNLDSGTLPASVEQGVVVARLFETWAHRSEARLLSHLADLKRHLARENEEWH